jgi:hypothetical protein
MALVRAFLQDIKPSTPGTGVLVVGHRATGYSLEALLGGRPLADVVRSPLQWRPYWSYAFAEA